MRQLGVFLMVLFVASVVRANTVDWMSYLKDSKFASTLPDCIDGSVFNMRDCDCMLEFNGQDQFGRLVGTLDLSLTNQKYDLLLEYLPQSEDSFRLEIKSSNYTRRLKSKDTEDLDFQSPAGDTEPTIIRFGIDPMNSHRDLTMAFHQSFPFKNKSYIVSGDLVRQ